MLPGLRRCATVEGWKLSGKRERKKSEARPLKLQGRIKTGSEAINVNQEQLLDLNLSRNWSLNFDPLDSDYAAVCPLARFPFANGCAARCTILGAAITRDRSGP
jgi:hypothetical protein